MSRHHMLPPIVYTPAPPKPKETKRRRGVVQGNGDVDEAEETSEATNTAPARGAQPLPQHAIPVEASERRMPSTTGHLSDGTLKAMLEMQEQDGAQAIDGGAAAAKE